eukprot:TRINITY_DN1754_c1_g1_i2.p1 TRINITY_DN1754_c1_g1~~TRINITY_DN1754_c1_g1_i2.p1  ORF type:complete len:3345 (-),score=1219.39 TRINITY_DN1754_c1_g1_i2:51-8879(-)
MVVEDTIFFRSLADAEMKKEAQNYAESDKGKEKKGWFSGFFSSSSKDTESKPFIELTDEQKDELYKTIGYSEAVEVAELPKEYVKVSAQVVINTAWLGVSGSESEGQILRAVISNVDLGSDLRSAGLVAKLSIGEFEVMDEWTKGTNYPKIITRSNDSSKENPILRLEFEQNPLDQHSDLVVNLQVEPSDVHLNLALFLKLGSVFEPEESIDVTEVIKDRAKEGVSAFSAMTTARMQDALASHKTIDLNVNWKAPRIIWPENVKAKDTSLLVVDLGELSVKTDLMPLKLREENPTTSIGMSSSLNDNFYDRFEIRLTNTRVLLVSKSSMNWLKKEEQDRNHMHLVKDFSIDLFVFMSINPNEISLAKMKVKGELPDFQLKLSPKKVEQLFQLLKSITTTLEASTKDKTSNTPTTPLVTSTNTLGSSSSATAIVIPPPEKKKETEEEKQLLLHRVLIDAQFKIRNVSLLVAYEETNHKQMDLVEFSLKNFEVQFVQRTYDMKANVKLGEIMLEDLLRCDGDLTPYVIASRLDDDDSSCLITIDFEMTSKESPEYQDLKTLMSIDFGFDTLLIIFSQNIIAKLIQVGLKQYLPLLSILDTEKKPISRPSSSRNSMNLSSLQKKDAKMKPRGDISMCINAEFKSFNLMLNNGGEITTEIAITKVFAGLLMYEQSVMEVHGCVGNLEINDNVKSSDGEELYPQILSVVKSKESEENMLDFQYATFNKGVEGFPGYEMSASASMRSIRFVFLNAFVARMQDYFLKGPVMASLNDNQHEKPHSLPSGAVLSDHRRNVMNSKDKAEAVMRKEMVPKSVKDAEKDKEKDKVETTRIRLEVTISTPQIIIPKSSKSTEHILIELGELNVTNSIQDMAINSQNSTQIDEMNISLSSINIQTFVKETTDGSVVVSKEEIRDSTDAVVEKLVAIPLLTDFDIKVYISRLLDLKYNDFFPQFSVKTNISKIHINLSELQLLLILEVLNGNLKEGQPAPSESKPVPLPSTKEASKKENKSESDTKAKNRQKVHTLSSTKAEFIPKLAVVELILEKFTFTISESDTKKVHPSLASFNLERIRVEAEVDIQNSIKANFQMHNMTLIDTRTDSSNQFRSIISAALDENGGENHQDLLSLRYDKSPMNDQHVVIHLNQPCVVVIPDILFSIQKFFMDALAKSNPSSLPSNLQITEEGEKKELKDEKKDEKMEDKREETEKQLEEVNPPESMIQAAIYINNVQLVLLHKPKKLDTQAIVLKTSLSVHYSANVEEDFSETKVYESAGGKKLKAHERQLVISDEPKMKAEIEINSIQALVCRPGLLDQEEQENSILRPLQMKLVYTDDTRVQRVKIDVNPVNLVLTYQDFKLMMGILEEVQKHQPKSLPPAAPSSPKEADQKAVVATPSPSLSTSKKQEAMQFNCKGLYITLINDFEGRRIPLIEFTFSELLLTVSNWTSNMEATVFLNISADYFNNFVVKYEPLIENWTCSISAFKRVEPQMEIKIESKENFNMNVSHALIDNLGMLKSILNRDYFVDGGEEGKREASGRPFSPYWIINQTGSKVTLYLDTDEKELDSGEEFPISYTHGHGLSLTKAESNSGMGEHRKMTFKIKGTTIRDFSLDKVGTHEFSIKESEKENAYLVLCKVALEEGSKLITIRSLVSVNNKTSLPLLIGFFEESQGNQRPNSTVGPVLPGASIAIPITMVRQGFISVKPAQDSVFWPSNSTNFSMANLATLITGEKEKKKEEKIKHVFDAKELQLVMTANKLESEGESDSSEIELIIDPPFLLENYLPLPAKFRLKKWSKDSTSSPLPNGEKSIDLKMGESIPIYDVNSLHSIGLTVEFEDQPESNSVKVHSPSSKIDGNEPIKMRGKYKLNLQVDSRMEDGCRKIAVYSPYWVINNSQLDIQFRQTAIGTGGNDFYESNKKEKMESEAHTDPYEEVSMFSYVSSMSADRMIVRTKGTKWSSPFTIDSVGTNGVVTFESESSPSKRFELGASLYLADGKYSRTKIVEFVPRFLIENNTSHTVEFKQEGTENEERKLSPGENIAFHSWRTGGNLKPHLSIKVNHANLGWSNGFSIEELGTFSVKLAKGDGKGYKLFNVEVIQELATTVMRICTGEMKSPYRIVNDTNLTLLVAQKGIDSKVFTEKIAGNSTVDYAWDFPTGDRILMVQVEGNPKDKTVEYSLDVLETLKPIKVKNSAEVKAFVEADGSSRILHLTQDEKKFKEMTDPPAKTEETSLVFALFLQGLGLSIIDSRPQELLFISVDRIKLEFTQSNIQQTVKLVISDFQIDNQISDAQFPVMLSYLEKKGVSNPFLQISLVRNLEHPSVEYISYLGLLIQEMSLKVDSSFINEMMAFVNKLPMDKLTEGQKNPVPALPISIVPVSKGLGGISQSVSSSMPPGDYFITYSYGGKMGPITKFHSSAPFSSITLTNLEATKGQKRYFFISSGDDPVRSLYKRFDFIAEDKGKDLLNRHVSQLPDLFKSETKEIEYNGTYTSASENAVNKKLYFKMLFLNSIKMNITFNMTGDDIKGSNPLNFLVRILGSTFASLDNAPVRLNALVLQDAFCDSADLSSRIQSHYTRQVITGLHTILGSADFLGNPVGLFNNFSTGFSDFFLEPAQGLIQGPEAFGRGLALGTYSLLKNSLYGTFNTASKITGAFGKGISQLSFDADYIRKRQRKKLTEKPKHAGEGIGYGLKALGSGFKDGVFGLVTQPIKGAKKGGAVGLIKGFGRGLAGLPVKPTVGVIDLVTKTAEGIRNTATMFEKENERARQPRYIGSDNVLTSYSESEAEGYHLLFLVEGGRFKNEEYLFHQVLDHPRCLIITNENTIMADKKRLDTFWDIHHGDVIEINLTKLGVLIKFDYEPHLAIIHAPDPDVALRIHVKLAAAIKNYVGGTKTNSEQELLKKKRRREVHTGVVSPEILLKRDKMAKEARKLTDLQSPDMSEEKMGSEDVDLP